MDCPECQGDITKVVLTRQLHQGAETGTLRRHACLDCGRRWFSFQPPPQVVPVPHVPQLTLPPQPSAIVPQRKPAGQAVIGVHGAGRESEVLDVRVNPAGVVGLPGVYVTLVELEGVRSDGVGLSDVTNVSGSHGFGALGPVMSAVDVDAIV